MEYFIKNSHLYFCGFGLGGRGGGVICNVQVVYITAGHDQVFSEHLVQQIMNSVQQQPVPAALYNALYRTDYTVNIEQVSERTISDTALI